MRSEGFSGHCLALTLLGSYLADAYNGDIRYQNEVAGRLGHDVRQGVHAEESWNLTRLGLATVLNCQFSAC